MGFDLIGVGAAPGDGTGDPLRTAAQKFNAVVTALNAAGWGSSGGPRPVVDYATAAALATNTYSAGVITASANGALSVDGASPAVGKRILVKDEASQLKNGVYVVTQAGDGTHPFILTRAGDYDSWAELVGCVIAVQQGTANAETAWQSSANDGGTLGTTAIAFVEASAGTINAARWAYLAAAQSFGGNLLAAVDLAGYVTALGGASSVRSALGLVIGTNVQAYSANLVTYASIAPTANAQTLLGHTFSQMVSDLGLVIGTNVQAYNANLTTYAAVAPSANAQTLLGHTFSQMRTDLGLVIGTDVQAYNANLTTYASVAPSANAQTLLGHTFAQMRTDLGLAIGTNVQAWSANLDSLAGFTTDTDATMAANSNTRLATQAAIVSYVSTLLDGRQWKQPVRVIATTNGALATAYANGQSVDGVTLATGDRIAITGQTAGAENGIYTVNASGAPTRTSDSDTSAELVNATFMVKEGTTYHDTEWTCTNNGSITVGTTALTFAQIGAGGGTYSADGTTLTLTGSTFSITTNGVGNAQLRQGAANSVVGRAANSTGNLADIAATVVGSRLSLIGTALQFSTVNDLTNDAAPDMSADYVETYDASASLPKKILAKLIGAGTEAVWFDAAAMAPRASNGCTAVATLETTTNKNNYDYLSFDPSTTQYACGKLRAPKGFSNNNIAGVVFVWAHPSTATNFGIVWGFQASGRGDGDALDIAWGTAQEVTDAGGATDTCYISAATAAVTPGGSFAAEDLLPFQIYRNATSGSDTLAVAGRLLGIAVLFTSSQNTDA